MIHPATELRHVSAAIGHGVFATRPIPCGTIVYVKDVFEIEITPQEYERLDGQHRVIADRYSYIDPRGVYIISWDLAKYVNHRCDCNTISTGWGFEIAIRDIAAGEEITDEYGLFNIAEMVPVACGCPQCRRVLRPDDVATHGDAWDARVRAALPHVRQVAQPLWDLLDPATRADLVDHLEGRSPYRSVRELVCNGHRVPPSRTPAGGGLGRAA